MAVTCGTMECIAADRGVAGYESDRRPIHRPLATGESDDRHRHHLDRARPRAGRRRRRRSLTLTATAAVKVRALLDQEGRDDLRLRVAVQPGGCSGLQYQLFFDERSLDGDVDSTLTAFRWSSTA